MGKKTPERIALEERAEKLGLKYPANLGDKKLTQRVETAEKAAEQDGSINNADSDGSSNDTPPAPQAGDNPPAPAPGGGQQGAVTNNPDVDADGAEVPVVTIGLVRFGGKRHPDGTQLDLPRAEAERLIRKGSAEPAVALSAD